MHTIVSRLHKIEGVGLATKAYIDVYGSVANWSLG